MLVISQDLLLLLTYLQAYINEFLQEFQCFIVHLTNSNYLLIILIHLGLQVAILIQRHLQESYLNLADGVKQP